MSLLDAEIAEQPEALARLLDAERANAAALADRLTAADVRSVLFAARGTSDNAARYGQYLLGVAHRLPVALATPSLYTRYEAPPRLERTLVAAISQSGRSPDIVAVLADGRRQGQPTLAITNDPSSPLAAEADAVLPLHAGEERSVAATKTYVNSLGALALLSACLSGPEALAALDRMPEVLAETLARVEPLVAGVAEQLVADRGLVIGRGYNYATAFEVALKIKELTGTVVEAFSSADVRHGPIAAAGSGVPVVLVAPSGAVLDDLRGLIAPLRSRGSRLAVISDAPDVLGAAVLPLPLPRGIPEALSPLTAVVPGQLLAARLATLRGIDVDRPGGLQKVTETR